MEQTGHIDRTACLLELGYTRPEAEQAAAKIERMAPRLLGQLDQWFRTGSLPEDVYEGFSAAELVAERGFTVPAAFLYLDWVLREPEAAKAALADMADGFLFHR